MDAQRAGMREVLLVWAIYAIDAIAILITYWRFSHTQFYNVNHDGFAAAAGRVLVFFNFSMSLVAVALLGFAVARLLAVPEVADRHRRVITLLAIVGTLLCFVTALPGVVDQSDLDAKPINVLPAIGVLIAIGLTVAAVRTGRTGPAATPSRPQTVRLVAIAVLAILALPWILADVGVYAGDIPGLKSIFMSKQFPDPLPASGEVLRAVHLGHHHGLDGTLFAISSLILAGGFGHLRPGRLQRALGWYLALMLPYGVANALNDGWYEQVVKRGWTDWRLPETLKPSLNGAWLLILLATVVVWFLLFRSASPAPSVSSTDTASLETRGGLS